MAAKLVTSVNADALDETWKGSEQTRKPAVSLSLHHV